MNKEKGEKMTFKDFWTNENNPELSGYLYGTRHIILLVVTLILSVALTFVFRKKSQRVKQIVAYCFGGVFLFLEILSRVVNLIITTNYSLENIFKILLPMHICSVMVWVLAFAVFSKKQVLYNYSVLGGLLATLAFLLYPAVGINRTYMSFTCLYSTVSHMLGFVFSVLLLTLGFAKFELKKIWQPILCFTLMFIWGAIVNFVIFPGSDYMYMINDPLELNLGFPYQILYVALILIYILCFHLGYELKQKLKKRKI